MSTRILALFLLSALTLTASPALGQDSSSVLVDRVRIPGVVDLGDSLRTDTSQVVEVTLADGTRYRGVVVAQDTFNLQLRQLRGLTVIIPRAQVRTIVVVPPEEVNSRFNRVDPNRTRLLFAPTARPLRSGEGYVSVYEIFFPFVAIGVRDILTMAGGISLIPGLPGQVAYFAPKVTVINRGRADAAVGVFYAIPLGFDEGDSEEGIGLVYGLVTAGPPTGSVTVGVGAGFYGNDFSGHPAVLLGAEKQVTSNIKLLTENYFISAEDESLLLVSGAVRIFGDRLAADFGLITAPRYLDDLGGFPFFPLISFAYNFNR